MDLAVTSPSEYGFSFPAEDLTPVASRSSHSPSHMRSWFVGKAVELPVDEDAADMLAMRADDEAALERIVHRWTPRLRSFLIRMVGRQEDVGDLVQETFVRVHQHGHRYQPKKPFATWIFQITANLARNRIRYDQRRPVDTTNPVELAEMKLVSNDLSPSDTLANSERAEAVRNAILNLPPMARETLIFSVYEELPHSEIAKIMKTTEKAVELRLYRARQLLKQELAGLVAEDAT